MRLAKLKLEDDLTFEYRDEFIKTELANLKEYTFSYNSSSTNIFLNGDFSNGLWKPDVNDCYNYDENQFIGMKEIQEKGNAFLKLWAKNHAACTENVLEIKGDAYYDFSFDYKSINTKNSKVLLIFNDKEKTQIDLNINDSSGNWNHYKKIIKTPPDANQVIVYVYSFETNKIKISENYYDNFRMIALSDLSENYYFISDSAMELSNPSAVDFELINPTKKQVHIKGATTPFYLAMSESYHDQWQAQLNNEKINGFFDKWVPWAQPDRIADEQHFELNGFLNGWYLDPATLCVGNNSACTRKTDGSYDMEVTIEFWPQRWFYLGLLISGTTLAGCLGYLGWVGVGRWRRRSEKKPKEIEEI